MIKRQLKHGQLKIYDAQPRSTVIEKVRTDELVRQTKSFLEDYFEGAFAASYKSDFDKYILASPDGFSYVLKTIFKCVWGRDLVKISTNLGPGVFSVRIDFNTSFLGDGDVAIISEYSEKSGFRISLGSGGIELCADTFMPASLEISSGMPQRIYNSLLYIFFYHEDVWRQRLEGAEE